MVCCSIRFLVASALAAVLGISGAALAEPTPVPTTAPLAEEFKRADTDGDGRLSEDEARKAGFFTEESFTDTDENHDGTITLFELGAAMQARFQGWIDRHARADTNGDGSVTKDEADAAGDSWSDYYARADRNNDGQVSRDELMYRVTQSYYSETTTGPLYPNIIDKRF